MKVSGPKDVAIVFAQQRRQRDDEWIVARGDARDRGRAGDYAQRMAR